MKRLFLLSILIVAIASAASAQSLTVGQTLDSFSMSDVNGKQQTLASVKGTNGTVLIFVSTQCPVVRGYNDRMNALVADYSSKGINIVGINSNVSESADQIKAHAVATYKFPVLIDKGNVFADRLNAKSTPEVFFLDAKNRLVYHGAIDNDRSGSNITASYVRAAFDSTLAGKAVATSSTTPVGCTIKRVGDK